MPFQLSPGVSVVEKDFSSIVPAVSTSTGAFAGVFTWGPVLDPVAITSENNLVQRFGKPTDDTAQSFFTAANFLAYANNLLTVRVDAETNRNAVVTKVGSISNITIDAHGDSYTSTPVVAISAPNIVGGIQATARAIVSNGKVDRIIITNHGTGYNSVPTVSITASTGTRATAHADIIMAGVKINNLDKYSESYSYGQGNIGEWAAKYPGTRGNGIIVSMADSASFSDWDYSNLFDTAPGTSSMANAVGGSNDELHIVVIDSDGITVLEKFAYVSKANDSRKSDGTNNYYKNVINSRSQYIWWMDHTATNGNWGQASSTDFDTMTESVTRTLSGGVDDLTPTDGEIQTAYSIFANDELYDISLIPVGKASAATAAFIIDNVAEVRKDCVVFVSPQTDNGDIIISNRHSEIYDEDFTAIDQINAYRNLLPSTSYAVMDSGYKYQYDRYNDKYRWVPLNGDVAGLCARTDYTNDPWFSPGGLNRGQIKNVIKLAVNPNKTQRDDLYKNGVNPVVSFPGQGTVLFGDKTLLASPSAFDRINVRRLFIVLEKAIATAAKFQLFEFNDPFTRAQFLNLVEPFLRDVQGRRGVTDFRVKCDETNNTAQVIDSNQFVADIFIKPSRSINFISLNFIAARSGVSFTEIGG
jgi:phage tail sheath protein FI